MEETCKTCANWEENIYWSHFQNIHFAQFLHSDFHAQLAIPQKFVNNLRNKLPENVSLKGPSGVRWNVRIATDSDALLFSDGWKEFVEDNSLREKDILIFKYHRESCFDVLMFDGQNLCEKEASYFVRKCENTGKATNERGSERYESGHQKDGGNASLNDVAEDTASKSDDSAEMSSEQHDISISSNRKNKRILNKWSLRSDDPSPSAVGATTKSRVEHTSISKQGTDSRVHYVSHRRLVNDEEIKNALNLALAASSDESFTAVMRPSQVYKIFYLPIPFEWASKYLSVEQRNVILRVKENTWPARYYNDTRGYGRLTSGWKNFSLENNLEEFDVCIFAPGGHMNNSIVLDVSIFRVVEEVIPPTRVDSSSRGRVSKVILPSQLNSSSSRLHYARRGRPSKKVRY